MRRVESLLLFWLALTCGACRCGTRALDPVTSEFRVEPAVLDFGAIPPGYSRRAPVRVISTSRGPLSLQVEIRGTAFSALPTELSLQGGDELVLEALFSPTGEGPLTGTLVVSRRDPVASVEIPLTGLGAAPCAAPRACHDVAWDEGSRACVDTARDAGPCSAPCLPDGQCRAGECVGAGALCEDDDLCTLDACSAENGCVHVPVDCPSAGLCRAAACEPRQGCITRELEDGTPCGSSACAEAEVCITGECQLLRRPNADQDCSYQALSAGGAHTCALTRGGGVRCWGENFYGQLGRPASAAGAPEFFSGFLSGATGVQVGGGRTCVVEGRQATCAGYSRPDAGTRFGPFDALAVGAPGDVCTITSGVLQCEATAPFPGLPRPDVASVAMGYQAACAVGVDGGVACWAGGSGPFTVTNLDEPVVQVGAGRQHACAATASGRGLCWALRDAGTLFEAVEVLDGGVRAFFGGLSSQQPAMCALGNGAARCLYSLGAAVPPGLAGVTSLAFGSLHGCALVDGGAIACWGNNLGGQLGDRSAIPLGPQQVASGGVAVAEPGDYGTVLLLRDGGLVGLGRAAQATPFLDGAQAVDVRNGESEVCVLTRAGSVECRFNSTSGRTRWDAGAHLLDLATQNACVASADSVTCGFGPGGRRMVSGRLTALAASPSDDSACGVREDAGLWCGGALGAPDGGAIATALPARDVCLGRGFACALLADGSVACWGELGPGALSFDGGTVPGAWPGARLLACGTTWACAVLGQDAVQCWGLNTLAQLGRDGLFVPQPVTFSLGERIDALRASGSHTCALLRSGKVKCWGRNEEGQLGFPPLLDSSAPVWLTQ